MYNYEQRRAKNAYAAATDKVDGKPKYKFLGVKGGCAVAKKVPTQIVQNGFLGALAFAIEKGEGYADVFQSILVHLADIDKTYGVLTSSLNDFLSGVCKKDANVLRAITEESLAYLNYLRRFAKPDEKDRKDRSNVQDQD